jgi:2-polyprenyl-3-methyl-5-hydroxy-6-metoxy-1,4-benzoquinol methylase
LNSVHQGVARYVETCPVGCAAGLTSTAVVLPEGPLLACGACGQLISQISEADYLQSMQAFNDAGFNLPDERAAQRRARHSARRLARIRGLLGGRLDRRARIIDVGCSRGDFVAAATGAGFEAEGVEPAPHIAAAARAAGRRVHTGLLEEQHFDDAQFDAVSLFEVVEHLREPLALLQECKRNLRPGGIMLISTGNAASWTARVMKERWDYFQIRKDAGHISFFNPHSIGLLAKRAGFELAAVRTSRVRFAEKSDLPAPVYAVAKLAAEALALPARLCGHGHDMLAYLRKR